MAGNYLEELVSEWYQFTGYFVRQNVLVGRRKKGGYDCELDIVAFHPTKKHIIHIEPSMDCHPWGTREKRFRKKFDAGRKHIPKIFEGFDLPSKIEQVALLVYASKANHQSVGGGSIMLISELLAQIIADISGLDLSNNAIPEHFTNLRTIQFIWEQRNDEYSLFSYPAWELCLGAFWEENLNAWHERWAKCGGRLYENRMIAAKWDRVWESLSSTFYDGLGEPYPPYAKSSCAYWRQIGQDEAIVIGVITESEIEARSAAFPKQPLLDREGNPISKELLEQALRELEESIYQSGGPIPGASRAERVAHERQRRKESAEHAHAEYERQNREKHAEREEQNAMFRLLEEVEISLREQSAVNDERRWEWLCESLNKLTTTAYFDRYPNWKARIWLACADMHRSASSLQDELASLQYALQINPQLTVKRRIKLLEQKLAL